MAPDVDAASAFYSDVIGWSVIDTGPEYGGYRIAQMGGSAAAGIGPQQEGARSAWTLYFASDDADATADAVRAAGGTLMMPPGDVGALGRMFIAMDPTGAPFGVWQAGIHVGSEIVNEPGGLAWEDLRTADADAARAFFGGVFGWDYAPMPGAPDSYQVFLAPGSDRPMGGIGPFMGPPTQPHWVVYFAVADADAAAAAAVAGGGTIVTEGFDSPFGRMVGLADPAGALFWVVGAPGDQPQTSGG